MYGIVDVPAHGSGSSKYALPMVTEGIVPQKNLSFVPYASNGCRVLVYKNELHIFGSTYTIDDMRKHYVLRNGNWISYSNLPYRFNRGCVLVWNDEIHLFGGAQDSSNYQSHYKLNGRIWSKVSTLPFYFYDGAAVVYNGEIHILGGGSASTSYNQHHKWNGTKWVSVSRIPYDFYCGKAVVYDGCIYLLGTVAANIRKNFYKWDGTEWTACEPLPYDFYNGDAVVFYDGIHLLGGEGTTNRHSIYSDGHWKDTGYLPFNHSKGSAEVYQKQILLIGTVNDNTKAKSPYMLQVETEKYKFNLPENATVTTPGEPYEVTGYNQHSNILDMHTYYADGGKFEIILPKQSAQDLTIKKDGNILYIDGKQYEKPTKVSW